LSRNRRTSYRLCKLVVQAVSAPIPIVSIPIAIAAAVAALIPASIETSVFIGATSRSILRVTALDLHLRQIIAGVPLSRNRRTSYRLCKLFILAVSAPASIYGVPIAITAAVVAPLPGAIIGIRITAIFWVGATNRESIRGFDETEFVGSAIYAIITTATERVGDGILSIGANYRIVVEVFRLATISIGCRSRKAQSSAEPPRSALHAIRGTCESL